MFHGISRDSVLGDSIVHKKIQRRLVLQLSSSPMSSLCIISEKSVRILQESFKFCLPNVCIRLESEPIRCRSVLLDLLAVSKLCLQCLVGSHVAQKFVCSRRKELNWVQDF